MREGPEFPPARDDGPQARLDVGLDGGGFVPAEEPDQGEVGAAFADEVDGLWGGVWWGCVCGGVGVNFFGGGWSVGHTLIYIYLLYKYKRVLT